MILELNLPNVEGNKWIKFIESNRQMEHYLILYSSNFELKDDTIIDEELDF